MAERKIVSADTLSKPKTKSKSTKSATLKLDLNKVKDFVVDNKDTIEKVVNVASDLMSTNTSKKKTTKSKSTGTKSTKKTTKKKTTKKDDSLSTMIDFANSIFKK